MDKYKYTQVPIGGGAYSPLMPITVDADNVIFEDNENLIVKLKTKANGQIYQENKITFSESILSGNDNEYYIIFGKDNEATSTSGSVIKGDNNILKGKNQMSDFSFDGSFLHEAGHSVHYSSNQNLFKTLLDEKNELVKEFQNNKEIRQTALKVSDYATTCPLEFVSEVWKRVQKGMTFSDDVMALYKKYGGPAVS